jgi:hypothetical protein
VRFVLRLSHWTRVAIRFDMVDIVGVLFEREQRDRQNQLSVPNNGTN